MGKRIAIVTGASSGMGREFVKQIESCTRTLDEIWVIARRRERLLSLQKEMKRLPLRILALDICKEDDLYKLEQLLETEKPAVRILVNGAGVGKAGCFASVTNTELSQMIELNDKALTYITHMVLPFMEKPSNIINLASASAFMPQKEFAIYAASKAFVVSFSRALYWELKKQGVVVTAVCPGPVDTEFLAISNDGSGQKPLKKLVTVKPEPVVAKALRDAKAGRELSVYGLPMKAVQTAAKLLPHKIFLRGL